MKAQSPTKPLFEVKEIAPGRMVKFIIDPMTLKESRKEFPYRPFAKNRESFYLTNPQGLPEWLLILNGKAIRCGKCYAATGLGYLKDSSKSLVCPDCDGRAELNGIDPRLSKTEYLRLLSHNSEYDWLSRI